MNHRHHENKEIQAIRKSFLELDENVSSANEQLRAHLNTLPGNDLITAIKELELSDLSLKLAYAWFSSTREDHNISDALKQIKKERGIRQRFDDDATDHLNYTSL